MFFGACMRASGMTQANILSVPTLVYAPFCLFNIISPLMSVLVALIGWNINKTDVQRPSNASL